MSQKETIEIQVPKNLLNEADECVEERGFANIEHFIVKAIRDAVNAEDLFTEEVREKIRQAREDDNWISLEEVKEEIEEEHSTDN